MKDVAALAGVSLGTVSNVLNSPDIVAELDAASSLPLLLKLRGIPVVLMDRAGNTSDFCSVSVDDVEGGRQAVEHLLDQGHTRIALVGGPGNLQQVRDRRLGAELASSRHESSAKFLVISTVHLDADAGIRAAEKIVSLTDSERPTAVFAANDLLAIGLLQGFVTAGLQVPDDMAIVGYDDIVFAAAAAVPLSSVRQPRLAIGYRAAELLFAEIEANERDTAHEHQQFQFIPELVVRRSSAKGRNLSEVVGA